MLLTSRVTGAGTLGCAGRAHGPSSAPTSATSAVTVMATRIHGTTVRADRDERSVDLLESLIDSRELAIHLGLELAHLHRASILASSRCQKQAVGVC